MLLGRNEVDQGRDKFSFDPATFKVAITKPKTRCLRHLFSYKEDVLQFTDRLEPRVHIRIPSEKYMRRPEGQD